MWIRAAGLRVASVYTVLLTAGVGLPGHVQAQFPGDSTQVVDVLGSPTSAPTLSRRTRNSKQADTCGKKLGRRRVVLMCLDLWPHRRESKRPIGVRP